MTRLPERLQRLLEHPAETVDPTGQVEIRDLHRRALAWERVDRLPAIFGRPGDTICDFAREHRLSLLRVQVAEEELIGGHVIRGYQTVTQWTVQ